MVVLLLAIAVGRIAEGMLLIAAFSLGLASVLVAIGIMVVKAGRLLDRVLPGRRTLACLPLLSAFVVTGLGLTITIEGLLQP
jgi:nickel/cobalt exporter